MMKVGFVSLGCSKNLVDTEVMLHTLEEAGFEIVAEDIEADVVVINTCAFITSAKQEAIDNILDVAWLKKHKNLKGIVVTGCLAERYREEIFDQLPEVDALIGVGSLNHIVDAVKSAAEGKRYASFEDKDSCPLGGQRILTTPPYTAYLKVAEGCDNRCTYCAIPNIRGKFRSRPIEDLVEEAKALEASGCKELNIVAQDTTRYGLDLYGEYSLARLVKEICAQTSIPWIRLLYCYPDKITDELIAEMRDNPRLLSYLDLPIQHINEDILRRMNRHGGSSLIKENLAKIKAAVPGLIVRTTVIVGFPGETDQQFEELCQYIKEEKFQRLGVFAYSPEEGTPAATYPHQIDEQVKQDRYDILMNEQLPVSQAYNQSMIGKVVDVLLEDFDPVSEAFYGRSYGDAPDVDGKIYFTAPGRRFQVGSFVKVRITDTLDYDLVGEPEE